VLRGERSRRLARPAAAAAALVLLVALLLARPGGPVAAARAEHVVRTTVTPLVEPERPIVQQFTAAEDALSSVTLRFGTFGGTDGCTLSVDLTSAGTTVARRQLACGSLPDSRLVEVLAFEPLAGSEGRVFELTVEAVRSDGEAVNLWAGEAGGRLPVATSGGDALPVSVELHTGYGDADRSWSLLGLLLRRVAQYGPFWQDPAPLVALCLGAAAALVLLTAARGRKAVALLLAFAVLKGVTWSAVLPPLEAADEVAHVAYAQFMADAQRIPRRGHQALGLPNFYSEQLVTLQRLLHQESSPIGDRPDFGPGTSGPLRSALDGLSPRANGDGAAAGYPPAYYVPAAVLYAVSPGPLFSDVAVMRLWSVALGALAVWLALLIGRRLFPGREAAAVALAVAVAAQPMFAQQTAVVNNDALLITASFACLLAALELVKPADARSRWLPFLAGAAVGTAVLGKQFGVAYLGVLGVAWLLGRRRTARAARPAWWREWLTAGAGLAATYGVWVLISMVGSYRGAAVGDLTAGEGSKTLRHYLFLLRDRDLRQFKLTWVDQLWGDFSWLDTPFPQWVQNVIGAALLAGAVLVAAWVVVTAVRWWSTRRTGTADEADAEVDDETLGGIVCLLAVVATVAVLYAVDFLVFRHTGRPEVLQGRYALMALPAILALPVVAIRGLVPRLGPTIPMVVVAAAMVAMNVGGLALLADRFYL
jgi:hypothetical protein